MHTSKNLKRVVSALLQLARVAARRFGVPPPASILAELEIEAVEAAELAATTEATNDEPPAGSACTAFYIHARNSDEIANKRQF